jgi:ATP-dependent Lon protease
MSDAAEEIQKLYKSVESSEVPQGLKERVLLRFKQLSNLIESPSFLPEFDRMIRYTDWILEIPWNKRTKDNLDIEKTKRILDKNHFGLDEIKDRIIEYISVMKLKKERGEEKDLLRAPILCFVGLVGTGKTTISMSIAEALDRKFARIPFGGMGDPLDLRGQSRLHAEAEPGKIIKALCAAQSKNPVILLDEVDRVTDEGRASIMGVLVELLDPAQNSEFMDHYINYPVDLSEVVFIATANNTNHISTAVFDRIEPISMPSYSDNEKITIGQKYVLPKVISLSGIPDGGLVIDDDVWPKIVRPLGFDAGIRTLERTIDGISRKIARMIVEGGVKNVRITVDNVKEFLPK